MLKNVKNTTLPGLFDLIAPHSCRGCGAIGSILCDRCKNNIIIEHKNFCPNCKSESSLKMCPVCQKSPSIYAIGRRQELIGQLAQDYKFQSIHSLAQPIAEILDQIIPEFKEEVIIVPLPTISKHIRERGLDHTYRVAKKLAKIRGKTYRAEKTLIRITNTVQVGTNKKTRASQAEKAYLINPKIEINNKANYLLLDDIWTTGSSMNSAKKLLQQAGVKKISLVVLAVS